MKILLLGYFGQDNFGDEAINRAVMRFLINEFGNDLDIYLCNQANYTKNITGKFEENCSGMPSFRVHETWFDSISYFKYDLVVVCNSGFVYGFCLDVVLDAIDKNIPVRIYAMKQGRPEGIRGFIYDKILEKSHFTIFRFSDHYKSFNTDNNRNIDGVDISYFNKKLNHAKEDFILICPRYYNDQNGFKQISIVNEIINQNKGVNFLLFNCSKDDAKISNLVDKNSNVDILNQKYTDVNEQIGIIERSNKIISLGRYHPLLFALKYQIPSMFLDTGMISSCYMGNKINNVCIENNIYKDNSCDINNMHNNYNYDILNKKISDTFNFINVKFEY